MLFTTIQEGIYEFPEEEWSSVTEEAKDLIRNLLVREPSKRFSAAQVLKHPWITNPPEATPLATPRILTRYCISHPVCGRNNTGILYM
jgi:serine/threonine protein kinase